VKKTGENMRGIGLKLEKLFFDPFLGFSSKALLFPDFPQKISLDFTFFSI